MSENIFCPLTDVLRFCYFVKYLRFYNKILIPSKENLVHTKCSFINVVLLSGKENTSFPNQLAKSHNWPAWYKKSRLGFSCTKLCSLCLYVILTATLWCHPSASLVRVHRYQEEGEHCEASLSGTVDSSSNKRALTWKSKRSKSWVLKAMDNSLYVFILQNYLLIYNCNCIFVHFEKVRWSY